MTELEAGDSKKKYWLKSWRESGEFVIIVVAFALFLDNLLLTIIVPIIPEYLYEKEIAESGSVTMSVNNVSTRHTLKDDILRKHQYLMEETTQVGYMFGSKAIIQLITNPLVGPFINRYGHNTPMHFGFSIMLVSTLLFAYGDNYSILFIARALQGVGSACASVSGMVIVATRFTDNNKRGRAMGLSLSGIAVGVIAGPPMGGMLYQFFRKTFPFLMVSVLILFGILLKLLMIEPVSMNHCRDKKSPSLKTLMMDPYILLTSAIMAIGNIGFAFLETSLSTWMIDTMNSESWELGIVFSPCSILYWIGISYFPKINEHLGRWLVSMFGMFFMGMALLLVPMAKSFIQLIIPVAVTGIANAMIECALLPELAYLVDIRHSSSYGNVFAIADFALCLGYGIGPMFCGAMVKHVGFVWIMIGTGIICFIFTPTPYMLKNSAPKMETENMQLVEQTLMSTEPKDCDKDDNASNHT